MTRDSRNFSRRHIPVLDQARSVSRALVSEKYRLDFDDFSQWPVDIKLYADASSAEKVPGAFAHLVRYERPGPVLKAARPDYFRICLQDPEILGAIGREKTLTLLPLLTYILTHEFIHVARFLRFMEIFDLTPEKRREEESIVHMETGKLLHGRAMKGLDVVLDRYHKAGLAVD